jgi:phosphatidylinositol glycan class V
MNRWISFAAWALSCRLAILILCIIADYCCPDHEALGVETANIAFSSTVTKIWLQPFIKWDSAHFLNIAKYGYDREYRLVFYPLFPTIIHLVSMPFGEEIGIITILMWNIVAVVLSSFVLKKILNKMSLKCPHRVVEMACICFVCNPASVFFTSLYTETTYTVLAWTGMCYWEDNIMLSCICLALASTTRSNGSLNAVVVGTMYFQRCGVEYYLLSAKETSKKQIYLHLQGFIAIIACLIPVICMNIYSFHVMCGKDTADYNPNCLQFSILQTPYAYLQQKYWNVGFMQAYAFKQIPNLILAVPIFSYSTNALLNAVQTLTTQSDSKSLNWMLHPALPWILHLLVCMIVAAGWAHLQVTTRLLLSASPLPHLALAQALLNSSCHPFYSYTALYIVSYCIVGCSLHCNFYPWT